MLAIVFRIIAADLLAHDPARRDAVDSDAMPSDLAGQAFGPGMYRGLGGERRIEPLRLGLAGYIDNASPAAFDHLRQQRMSNLSVTREIQRDGLIPIAVGGIDGQWPAATGVVDQYVHMSKLGHCRARQLFRGILLHDILRHWNDDASRRMDFLRKPFKQVFAPGDGDHAHALQRERLCYRAPDPGTGSTHDGGL